MRAFVAPAALALAASLAAAAIAGDEPALQAKVRAALRSAKSFVATVVVKPAPFAPAGGKIVYTVVAPDRYRQQADAPPNSDDTIVIGHQVYGSSSKGWDVQTWSDRLVTGFEGDLLDVEIVAAGPDTTVAGKAAGTFTMRDPHGEKPTDTLACTYDKTSFRPIECTAGYETMTFSRFDDPTVTIPTPEHATPAGGQR